SSHGLITGAVARKSLRTHACANYAGLAQSQYNLLRGSMMHTTMTGGLVSRRRAARTPRIGPADDGRRMPLAVFSRADVEPGYLSELAHGVVEVTNIPSYLHNLIVDRIHAAFHLYQAAHAGIIHFIAGSFASKIEMWGSDTERHPDLSAYLSPPPHDVDQPWDR